MSEHVSVYVTCPDRDTARRIARELLARRLVACANLAPVESLYWWQGAIEEAQEVAMLLKTRRELADQVVAAVAELHPYEVPCAVALPLAVGHAPFLDWIDAQTRQPGSGG